MSYLEIESLTKIIKGKKVLDNVNLSIEKGKIYGITGKNGSGKTMLFREICGLIKPTMGTIKINGKELHKDISFPESIGVIIENPGFWDNYTAFENLKIISQIKNIINDDIIFSYLEKVKLDDVANIKYKKFSLGMKQRLAIAQALMETPELLVLDEPTNALDEDGCNLVRRLLLEEKKRGTTILIASHNSEDIDKLADIKIKIIDGRIVV